MKRAQLRSKVLHIQTGSTCQNNCVFCCDKLDPGPSMNPEDVRIALRQNVDLGEVQFTRHEPTLNRNLEEYIGWAKSAGFQTIALITNGRRLGKGDFAARLVEAGLNKIEISLHGHTSQLHDSITQKKGSFKEAVAGIEAVVRLRREHDIQFKLHSTVIAMNVDHLPAMADFMLGFAPDSYGLNAVFLSGQAALNAKRVALPYSAVVESFLRCIDPVQFRPIGLSEVPACQTYGRLPPNYIGWREDFQHVRLDVAGEVSTEHQALSSPRGFLHREACQSCVFARYCDGLSETYIKLFGWGGFDPITELDQDVPGGATFVGESELLTLCSAPSGEWEITDIEHGFENALLVVRAEDPERLVRLWITPRRDQEPAFRRTKRFNIALRGEGYSQAECDLAESIADIVSERESRQECNLQNDGD